MATDTPTTNSGDELIPDEFGVPLVDADPDTAAAYIKTRPWSARRNWFHNIINDPPPRAKPALFIGRAVRP